MEEDFKDVSFICPICDEVLTAATKANCGHLFCKYCIIMWGKYSHVCPECSNYVTPLKPDLGTDEEISAFFTESTDEDLQAARDLFLDHRADDLTKLQESLTQSEDIFHSNNNKKVSKLSTTLSTGVTVAPSSSHRVNQSAVQVDKSYSSPYSNSGRVLTAFIPNKSSLYKLQSKSSLPLIAKPKLRPIALRKSSAVLLFPPNRPESPSQYMQKHKKHGLDYLSKETMKLEKRLKKTYNSVIAVGRKVTAVEDSFAEQYFSGNSESQTATTQKSEDSDQGGGTGRLKTARREGRKVVEDYGDQIQMTIHQRRPISSFHGCGDCVATNRPQTRMAGKSSFHNTHASSKVGCKNKTRYTPTTIDSGSINSNSGGPSGSSSSTSFKAEYDKLLHQARSALEISNFLQEYSLEKIAADLLLDYDDTEDVTQIDRAQHLFSQLSGNGCERDDVIEDAVNFNVSSTEEEGLETDTTSSYYKASPSVRPVTSVKDPNFKVHPEVQNCLKNMKTKIVPRIPLSHQTREQQAKRFEPVLSLFRRIREECFDGAGDAI